MTKAREFHLNQKESVDGFHIAQKYNGMDLAPHWIHVREVIPIDWDKIWSAFACRGECGIFVDDENIIQELVEQQLKGEESSDDTSATHGDDVLDSDDDEEGL